MKQLFLVNILLMFIPSWRLETVQGEREIQYVFSYSVNQPILCLLVERGNWKMKVLEIKDTVLSLFFLVNSICKLKD